MSKEMSSSEASPNENSKPPQNNDITQRLEAIYRNESRRVLATHGYADELARYLAERGHLTGVLPTAYQGEADL